MTQVSYLKNSFEANPNEPYQEEIKVQRRETRATQTQRLSVFRSGMAHTFAINPTYLSNTKEQSTSPRPSVLRSTSALLGSDAPRSPSRRPERSITHIPKLQFLTLSTQDFEKKPIKREATFHQTTLRQMKTKIELGSEIDDGQTVIMSESNQDIRVTFILDRKRIVAIKILNFVAFLILLILLFVQYFAFKGADIYKGDSITKSGMYNPFQLMRHVDVLSWVVLQFFFLLFSTMPLLSTRDNYDLLLFEKIKYRFVVLAFLLAGFTIVYSFGAPLSQIWLTPILAFILKNYEYFFIYTRIKYHDDGHDFVSRLQFICLHLTFSFSSAWLTYITVFSTFNSMSLDSQDGQFLDWHILNWQKLFQVLIFSQACINLACYKDIFFALMMALVFIGQYLRGMAVPLDSQRIAKDCDGDRDCIERFQYYEGQRSESLALGFFIVLVCFIVLLLASNFRSVFYLKYNVLMNRLTKMKPKPALIKEEIKEKRRPSQRPVPMEQLVRLVPNQAYLRSSSLSDGYFYSKSERDLLDIKPPTEVDNFDISEQEMQPTETQHTQRYFGRSLKTKISDIINESKAHHQRYVEVRKIKRRSSTGSFEENNTMRQMQVSQKVHRYSELEVNSPALALSPYSFYPEYHLQRGMLESRPSYEVNRIFGSSAQFERVQKKKRKIQEI